MARFERANKEHRGRASSVPGRGLMTPLDGA